MEWKSDALVLRTVDYGESDKMATLLTSARGKVGAAIKGVKKAGAKLKFAAQPFCFAEYVFAERAGRNTVISASLYDGFYPLREDISALYAATAVCEACNALLLEGMEGGELLIQAVTAFGRFCEGDVAFALLEFLITALRFAGYPVTAERCPLCGEEIVNRCAFDMSEGAFYCGKCAKGVTASEITYRAVRAALYGAHGGEKTKDITPDGTLRALRLMKAYFHYQTEAELPALGELIGLIESAG